jgi:hypothetical protein
MDNSFEVCGTRRAGTILSTPVVATAGALNRLMPPHFSLNEPTRLRPDRRLDSRE